MAYVEAIRRAERFSYIENQYFIGGCHWWKKDRHSGCTNLIPIEIALKVVSKIKAKERFAVYIVIPMWPEGEPELVLLQIENCPLIMCVQIQMCHQRIGCPYHYASRHLCIHCICTGLLGSLCCCI